MREYLVISGLGEDRPGIAKEVSEKIQALGCNISDSRMMVLGGEFAIILLVSGEAESIAALLSDLPQLEQTTGLVIQGKRTTPVDKDHAVLMYRVEATSMDQPGIVHQITGFFSSRDINIRDLGTEAYAAAHSGIPMFALNMVVEIPAEQKIGPLRQAFGDFCDELYIDASLQAGT